MEDILSSIRKIVSQEEKGSGPGGGAVRPSSANVAGQRLSEIKESKSAAAPGSLAGLAEQVRGSAPQESGAPAPRRREPEKTADARDTHPKDVFPPPRGDDVSGPARSAPASAAPARELTAEEEEAVDAISGGTPVEDSADDREAHAFREALVAPGTRQAVSGSFEKMKRTVLENIDGRMDAMMRPMLAEWLDEHLPQIVERIVREEVQRLASTD